MSLLTNMAAGISQTKLNHKEVQHPMYLQTTEGVIKTIGMSLLTNMAAGISQTKLNHKEVQHPMYLHTTDLLVET